MKTSVGELYTAEAKSLNPHGKLYESSMQSSIITNTGLTGTSPELSALGAFLFNPHGPSYDIDTTIVVILQMSTLRLW